MDKDNNAFPSATHIDVEAEVRYWEDATVNGVYDDDDSPQVFGVVGKLWKVRIRLADGQIEGWPTDMQADIHYKVCDQGEYWLSDAAGTRIAKWRGHYVPDEFLCHGDDGFGDYIILKVALGGMIGGYKAAEIFDAQWQVLEQEKVDG